MTIIYMRNLVCLFVFLITVISGSSNSSREFGVGLGVGVVVDVDSLEGKLGLSYLLMAARHSFYATYQSYNTGLVLRVSDSKGRIISSAASDETARALAIDEERVAIRQQKLTAFGHISESFSSTNPFSFVPFNGSYDDLVHEIHSKKFDEAVGDTEITTNGFRFVSGRYQRCCDDRWRFMKPFITRELWLTSIALFLLTGAAIHIAGEGGRDANRLEYFSMTIYDPRHAREILDIDDEGGGSSGSGYSSAARGQLPEMDTGGGRQRWWKKVWRLLKPTAQR